MSQELLEMGNRLMDLGQKLLNQAGQGKEKKKPEKESNVTEIGPKKALIIASLKRKLGA